MTNEEKHLVDVHRGHDHEHHDHGDHEHHHHSREVTVTVDGKPREIKSGTYVVTEFKRLVGIEASRVVDEVIHGEFKQLNDNEHITIKACEIFVSHVRQGGSS